MLEPTAEGVPLSKCSIFALRCVATGNYGEVTFYDEGTSEMLAIDVGERYAAILLKERGL